MQKNTNPLFLDINSLIFRYEEISLSDFSLFTLQHDITENDTLPLLYFLILKNNLNFFYLVKDKILYNFSSSSYSLQLTILKTYSNFDSILSNNLNNSSLISILLDYNIAVKQILFDFSVLFDDSNNILFFTNKTNVQTMIFGRNPIDKYHLFKDKMTLKQEKQFLSSCLNEFRVSSFFIVNELFIDNPNIFTKKIMLTNMNFISKCNQELHKHLLSYLLNIDKNVSFISGFRLSYSVFDYNFIISCFENLYVKNSEVFSIMACGFISNPKNYKPDVSHYLIKKLSFIDFSNKFINKHQGKSIFTKI